MLTVLAAAAAARGGAPRDRDRLDVVAVAAVGAARTALRATPAQLPALARAGVVDAGGIGLYVVLDALAALVVADPAARCEPPHAAPGRAGPSATSTRQPARRGSARQSDYEVMYLLDALRRRAGRRAPHRSSTGSATRRRRRRRPRTAPVWNVHVHCNDIGAALEAGIAAGRPHRITVVRFADRRAGPVRPRPGRAHGGRAVRRRRSWPAPPVRPCWSATARRRGRPRPTPTRRCSRGARRAPARGTSSWCPATPSSPPPPSGWPAAARRGRAGGARGAHARRCWPACRRSPCTTRRAARGTTSSRWPRRPQAPGSAALLVAETEALTWVGRCEPGDVLGCRRRGRADRPRPFRRCPVVGLPHADRRG